MSFIATSSARNFCYGSNKGMKNFASDLDVSPVYGTTRIPGAASTSKTLRTSPRQTQRRENLVENGSSFIAF